MRNILLLFLICSLSVNCFSQTVDSLTVKRKVFQTEVLFNNVAISNSMKKKLYEIDKVALRKHKNSRKMLFTSPFLVAGGIYYTVDGLVGIKRVATIDGIDYPYVERSLPKVLLGLALFVTGGAFMEGSNDMTVSAVKRYNDKMKKKLNSPKTAYLFKFGITEGSNVGFRVEF